MNGNCQFFIDRLEPFLEGNLDPAERCAVEEHLRDCSSCGELTRMFRADRECLAVEPPPDLVAGIVRGTSGSVCAGAHPRLCDHVDRLLDAVDEELVRSHLDGCPDCAGLSRALLRLSTELPGLTEIEADEPFVQAVLSGTSRRRRPKSASKPGLAERWQRFLARPRLAWEASYVGTFVLALLFLMPWSPLAGVTRSTLDSLRGGDGAGFENPLGGLGARLASDVPEAWDASGGRMITALNRVPADIDRLGKGALSGIERGLGTLSPRDTSGPENTETSRSAPSDRTEGDEP